MICEQAYELMSAKLDGALSTDQEAELAAHLASCPKCRRVMEAMQAVEASVSALREPAPEGLKKGVLYRVDQATGKAKSARRRWIGPGTVFGAVAALLVLLVGAGVIQLPRQRSEAQNTEATLHSPDVTAPEPVLEAVEGFEMSLSTGKDNASLSGVHEPLDTTGNQPAVLLPAPTAEPEADPEKNNSYYRSGQDDVQSPEGLPRMEARPVDEETRRIAAARSQAEDALVLLYSEFSPGNLFTLLQTEEPALYEKVQALHCEEADGLLLYRTDCGTALAVHEWILENLPHSEQMDQTSTEAETRLRIRMEALDPQSGSLYRIITWAPRAKPIAWPTDWPADWAVRLRLEENWELFFPTEDYAPSAEKPAMLAFMKE